MKGTGVCNVFKQKDAPKLKSFNRADVLFFLEEYEAYIKAHETAKVSKEQLRLAKSLSNYLSVKQLKLIAFRKKKRVSELSQVDLEDFLRARTGNLETKCLEPVKALAHCRLRYDDDVFSAVADLEMFIDEQVENKNINPDSISRDTKSGRKALFDVLQGTLQERLKTEFKQFRQQNINPDTGETMDRDPNYLLCIEKYTNLAREWFRSYEVNYAVKPPARGTKLDPESKGLHTFKEGRPAKKAKVAVIAAKPKPDAAVVTRAKSNYKCWKCNGNHLLAQCQQFRSEDERKKFYWDERKKRFAKRQKKS